MKNSLLARIRKRIAGNESGNYIVGFMFVLIPMFLIISAGMTYGSFSWKWNDMNQAADLAVGQMEVAGYYDQQANNEAFDYMYNAGIDPSQVSVVTTPATNVSTVGVGSGADSSPNSVSFVPPLAYGRTVAVAYSYQVPILLLGMKVTNPVTGNDYFTIPAAIAGTSQYIPQ